MFGIMTLGSLPGVIIFSVVKCFFNSTWQELILCYYIWHKSPVEENVLDDTDIKKSAE